ncbi:MAG TPA: OmpA family protein [Rhodanobacteraceae bacterium]|nr:OmpA family protein [Rhodanobacteraceae bacterium]
MNPALDGPRYTRATWIVAVLLAVILAILWLSGHGPADGACCGGDAAGDKTAAMAPALTPPPPMQSTAKAPGPFAVRLDGDKRVVEGTVTDPPTKQRVLQAATAAYGETAVVDRIGVDATIASSSCAAKAETLFAALKTDPPIGIACDTRGGVTLSGKAISDADKASRERWAHDFFGPDTAVVNAIEVAAPSPPVARPEDVRCAARMPAAVTFKTASSRIDAKGRALLDAIAPCLKNGNFEIAGYTDNIGTADDNMKLAQARAESVRAYMILKGVDAERLVAVGHGADRPVGDNETTAGRASNRRIEFAKK